MRTITLSTIVCLFAATVAAQQQNSMITYGLELLGTPYVANTLEQTDEETLFTDHSRLDCTTFVETVMAMSLSAAADGSVSEEDFARNLQRIRYRDGIIDGYTSRLHYIADWINDNIRKGIIIDVTAANSNDRDTLRIFFMSKNAERYKHLKQSPRNVEQMIRYEQALTGQEIRWLPKNKLPDNGLEWIQEGDIIMLTTNIDGLDVSHAGIAIYRNGKLHLLHASSTEKKVVIDKRTLRRQLLDSKHVTGIRVLRLTAYPKSSNLSISLGTPRS